MTEEDAAASAQDGPYGIPETSGMPENGGPPQTEGVAGAEGFPGSGSSTGGLPGTSGVPGTGDARVDEAVARLGELADAPLDEHPVILGQIHDRLREVLGELGSSGAP